MRPPARAPLAEETGRRVVAQHPARLDAFARDGGEDQVAERIAAELRDPRDVDAEPRQGDREVRLGAREAERQRHAEPQLAVLQRVEQRHRLAERQDPHAEVVDRDPVVEVEEVEPPRVDGDLDRRVDCRPALCLEPRDHHRAPLHRLRLEPLKRRSIDVAGDLAYLLGEHRLGRDLEVDEELGAERLGRADGAAEAHTAVAVRLAQVLRPDSEADRAPGVGAQPRTLGDRLGGDRQLLLTDLDGETAAALGELRLHEVHRRAADEARDEEVRGPVEDHLRIAGLLQHAVAHHGDAVAHRHRLHLVVRDVDRRHAQLALHPGDLRAHLHAQAGVEVRERLVHQEDPRLAHDRAAHRDALALAAGELARLALQQVGQAERLAGALDAAPDLGLRRAARAQAEGDVVEDRHVRIERVVLEDHRHVALARIELVDRLVADRDLAGGDLLEAGDHAQGGRLAAAGGPDEDHELARLDLEREVVDRRDVVVAPSSRGRT